MKPPEVDQRPNSVASLALLLFQGSAVMFWTLSAWSLTSSLSITGTFAAGGGMFSNWIVLVLLGTAIWYFGRHVERELTEHPVRMPKFAWARRNHPIPPDDRSAAAA